MPDIVTTAGGVPVGIPADTFELNSWKNNTIISFPEVGYPWNWTARAYLLDDESLIGPLWSFIDEVQVKELKIVSGRGENKQVIHVSEASSIHIPSAHRIEILTKFIAEERSQGMVLVQPKLDAGHYHPRIWRAGYLHSENKIQAYPRVRSTRHFASFVAGVRRLESLSKTLNNLFLVIHPADENAEVYGGDIRNLLLLACTEVECQWRAVLKANSYRGNRFSTNDYVKLLPAMRLNEYKIRLTRYPAYKTIIPFANWASNMPTKSIAWYDAYNKIKHDPEGSLSFARFGYAIESVAAAFVMLVGQFGLFEVRQSLGDDTFFLEDFPRWMPSEWYYQPPPKRGRGWTEIQFAF